MPNKTGGKNYKKTKHSSEVKQFVERQDDQLYARVLQILGNRNVLSYCNDNKIRLCHIRGSIRKDMWISKGDIILVSIRDFLREESSTYEKGDIIYKYDPSFYSKIKKDNTINIRLFNQLENSTIDDLKRIATMRISNDEINHFNNLSEDNDDLFEYAEKGEEVKDNDEDIDIDNI
jgi:initiation factor 1A